MTNPNPAYQLVCCVQCGRDTRNANAICGKCGGKRGSHVNEQKGRHIQTNFDDQSHEGDYSEESDAND